MLLIVVAGAVLLQFCGENLWRDIRLVVWRKFTFFCGPAVSFLCITQTTAFSCYGFCFIYTHAWCMICAFVSHCSPQVFTRIFSPLILFMWDRRYGYFCGKNKTIWVYCFCGGRGGGMWFKYVFVLCTYFVTYVWVALWVFLLVRSQYAWAYSCGSVCTCALDIRCLLLSIREAICCLMCGWLYLLGSFLASNVMCSLPLRLIIPSLSITLFWNGNCLALACVLCGYRRHGCLTMCCCVLVRSPCWG